MPKQDPVAVIGKIVAEADALIRRRLEESRLRISHLLVAVTPDGQVILRSNVSPDVLRSLGEDLKNVADDITAPPDPGDTTH